MSEHRDAAEVRDADLLAYNDGAAPDDLRELIEGAPELRARAERLRHQEALLRAAVARADRPSTLELGEMALGELDPEREAEIVRYLEERDTDGRVAAELAHMREAVAEPLGDVVLEDGEAADEPAAGRAESAAGGAAEGLRRIVATLVSGPGQELAMGMRGSSGAYVYEAETIEVTLVAQRSASRPGTVHLTGMIAAEHVAEWHIVAQDVGGDGQTLDGHRTESDEFGAFEMRLVTATYRIHLRGHGLEVTIPELTVD